MIHRSIFAGMTPTVTIKSGASVIVEGWEDEHVAVETGAPGGLKLERRTGSKPSRAPASITDHAPSDARLMADSDAGKRMPDEVIEVQIGSDGRVRVPLGSCVKVYAGANVEVSLIQGRVSVIAGGSVRVRNVHTLVHGSSGGAMDLECETIVRDGAKFEAGRDLRCRIRDLASARVLVNDQDGYRERVIGSGELMVRLKAGGYVTLMTDQIQAFKR